MDQDSSDLEINVPSAEGRFHASDRLAGRTAYRNLPPLRICGPDRPMLRRQPKRRLIRIKVGEKSLLPGPVRAEAEYELPFLTVGMKNSTVVFTRLRQIA